MSKVTLNHIKGLIGIGLFGFALGSAAPAMAACPNGMTGTGLDAANACQIEDWDDLASIGLEATQTPDNTEILGFHYKLMNDLDQASAGYASHNPWVPIKGPSVPKYFFGTFDGNGFSIKDINFNNTSADRFGLFERLEGGEVFNLTISDFTVKAGGGIDSQQGVGMIAPLVQSSPSAASQERGTTIQNVVIKDGTIEVTSPLVGGLVGLAQSDTSIADIAVDNVTISIVGGTGSAAGYVGGVVGDTNETDLERVYFNGSIAVTDASAPRHVIGGVVGRLNNGASITDAYAIGSLASQASDNWIGGVLGAALNFQKPQVVKNVYSAMEISADSDFYIGGLVANAPSDYLEIDTLLNTSFYDAAQGAVVPGSEVKGASAPTSDMLTTKLYTDAGWDFDTVWQQVEGTSYPYFKQAPIIQAPAPQPRTITCPTGLTADTDGACLVTNWDDLKKLPDAPVLSYRLANDIDDQSTGYMTNWTPLAVFGGTLDGNGNTISDLAIDATNDNGTGLFSEIGGSGRVSDLALVDFSITWSGKKKVGSLAGILSGVIENSYFQGTIVRGSVSGIQHGVGGVVGSVPATASNARLERVAADVSIDTGSSGQWVGGIAGELRSGTLKDSYFSGELKGTGNSQGGLVGFRLSAATITNSYSSANFTATNTPTVGGINLGGSAGVTSSYWDQGVIGNVTLSSDSGGEARETVEMKSRSTFSGWDFGSSSASGVWSIIEEATVVNGEAATKASYPYLTALADFGFIDITDADVTGEETITPPLELAATSPFTPAASAQDVVPFTAIRVEFSEDIAAVTNTSAITLKDSSSASVSAAVAISDARVTITPNDLLSYDETYTVTIPAGTLKAVANDDKENITVSWSFSTQSATVDGGDGCPARMINFTEDPNDLECVVTDWAQLSAIGASVDNLGLKYVLANNLGPETLGYEELVATPTKGWNPIGSKSEPFHGVFDGQGYIIEGLKIAETGREVGLFARIAKGHVKNLVLRDVDIEGLTTIGALAGLVDHATGVNSETPALPTGAVGQTETKIEQVFASGTVKAKGSSSQAFLGGLIGRAVPVDSPALVMSEVGFAGTVNGGSLDFAGGLIGHLTQAGSPAGNIVLSSAYFVGDITARDYAGGIFGSNGFRGGSGAAITVSDAYTSVGITLPGTREYSGALFGGNFGSVVLDTDVYWLSEEDWEAGSGTQEPVPAGSNSSNNAPTGESMVEVTSANMLGTVAATTLATFDFASTSAIWEVVTENTPGAFGDGLPILKNLDAESQALGQLGPRQCPTVISDGFGIAASPCEISDWNELKAINEFPSSFYTLTADLDKNTAGYSATFTALDPFTGTFDGNNKTISDLVINQTATGNSEKTGLFSELGGFVDLTPVSGVVKNLTLANVDIKSNSQRTGALAGLMRGGEVDNVHVSGKVRTNNTYTGGLIGSIEARTEVTLSNSSSSAVVSAGDSGRHAFGGLVGNIGPSSGTPPNVSITGVFVTGDVSAMYNVGGLIGAHGNGDLAITDAYATGAVSGQYQLGGLMGQATVGADLNRVYASGKVTRDASATFGADRVGGLIGQVIGIDTTVTNAYWDAQSTGQSSSAGSDDAAGLTTAQMTGAAASTNMTGFAFGETDAWSVTTQGQTAGAFADGYPHLRAPLPLQPQLDGQNIGLGSVGISLEGVALTLFNDIISEESIELSADNTAALQAAATAATTIVNVANGTQPRADLTLAMLTGIGITGVTADNLNGATIAIRAVTDTATINSVAGVQGVINAGVTAFEDAAPVFDDFFEETPGSTPPSADDYTDIGVKDVTTENGPAINDLVANTGIDSIDPEGIQNVVDVYNEIIDALSDDPVRDPDLTAIDYAALGLGDIITNDDAADLLNSLLAEEGVTTIKAWGSATPATTFDNLKSRAELAAKVIAGANGDPATPAALVTADLEGLGVDTVLTTEPQVDFFNEVIGGSTGPEVSSVETLQAMAGAVAPVLGGTADIDDYNAIGLNLTNGMLDIFDEVLGDVDEDPITYATIKGIADATSNLINLAAGVGSTNPLPILEVLETLGIEVDADVIGASSEVYLAIAAADPTTLTSVAALDTLVTNAVTAANTFELTVVNGSLSGAYVSGTSVTLVANSAPEGQYFAGWTGATVADNTAPVTTLTMPGSDATVTATFQDIPEPKFNLTVASGTGAGSYEAGQQITISAALPAEGKIFDRWTGGDGVIDNPTNAVATLVMPAANQAVTATYIDDPDQLFGLNVGSGSGSGEYKAGDRVAIGANPAAEDKLFDRWGGDVEYIDNAANPNTRVTMPRDSVTVVAIYVDKPEPEFDLTVTGGEGTGQFVAGTSITISAGIPAEGKLFDRWLGDTAYVDNVNEPNTQVTMPAGDVSLRASYADIPDPLFTLSVEGGQGDGDYEAGDVVTISAGLPPTGQIFDQWIGQTSRLGNVSQPNTTLTMPASDVSIRATYKDKPVTRFALSVTSGTGEGSYEQGQVVTIEANVPAADQVFDRWTGQTGALANVNVPNTTLVMPGSDISVTATYKADPESTPTLGRGRGRGRSLEGGKPGPFTGRQLVDELVEEQIPAGTFVALSAPEAPVVLVNNEPVDFYFDKWVGQTAYLNNVHATTAFMVMPDHDLTVLAQFRSIDGTMTVTADGTTVTLEGAAITADSELTPGSVVKVVAAAPASGFMFDKWIGQTAYLTNVNVPETNLTVPGTNVEIRATYRRVPDGDTSVSIAGADAEAQTPGTYIALEAAAPAAGESFDLWGGQNSYVEDVFAGDSRMFVPATAVSIAPVYKSAFGQGVDPEAAEAILDFDGSQSTAPTGAVYESAGITGVDASNVAVYNAALVALGPTQLSDVQAVVTTYNAILTAANGNASTPATLTVADYAILGVTVAAGEELAVVNQAVGSQSAAGVDTISEVEAIAESAGRFLTVAGGGTPSAALTPADFARLGFDGITNANIDEAIAVLVQAVTDGADPADIGSLQALFDELAPPPLPVPTLSTWMLLLMALMMWMVIRSRRSLLDR